VSAPLETLCLTRIADDKYRLYTTEALTFVSAYDPAVSLYLTESLWRLSITEHDLDRIVRDNTR
jgi:hypothetical protein